MTEEQELMWDRIKSTRNPLRSLIDVSNYVTELKMQNKNLDDVILVLDREDFRDLQQYTNYDDYSRHIGHDKLFGVKVLWAEAKQR